EGRPAGKRTRMLSSWLPTDELVKRAKRSVESAKLKNRNCPERRTERSSLGVSTKYWSVTPRAVAIPARDVSEGVARPRSTCDRNGFEIPAAVAVSSSVLCSRCRSARILLPKSAAWRALSTFKTIRNALLAVVVENAGYRRANARCVFAQRS